MSKKFVNNKFNGAIDGKRCKDYYKESKKYGSDVYEQIEKDEEYNKWLDAFENEPEPNFY